MYIEYLFLYSSIFILNPYIRKKMFKSKSVNAMVTSNANSNTLFIFVITIFILFSLLIHLKPEWFVFLFHTILGQICLASVVAFLFYIREYKLAFGLGCIFVLLFQTYKISSENKMNYEGFSSGANTDANTNVWPKDVIERFLEYSNSVFPMLDIDLDMLMSQASVEEVEHLMRTYKWPWSQETKDRYIYEISRSKNISSIPGQSLDESRSIFNENAMKQLLFWNSKKGSFILDGVSVGGGDTVIKCNALTGKMEKTVFKGYDSVYASPVVENSVVADADIPAEIPGFEFLGGACNPCASLIDKGIAINSSKSCAFSVKKLRPPSVDYS